MIVLFLHMLRWRVLISLAGVAACCFRITYSTSNGRKCGFKCSHSESTDVSVLFTGTCVVHMVLTEAEPFIMSLP
jgi:hypothetical protein